MDSKSSRLSVEKFKPISYTKRMYQLDEADDEVFRQVPPLFNAMGDETRQQIMWQLGHYHTLSVNELSERIYLSRPAVSHHLKVLREAGLVWEEKRGVRRYYHPTFKRYLEPMKRIIMMVEEKEGDA